MSTGESHCSLVTSVPCPIPIPVSIHGTVVGGSREGSPQQGWHQGWLRLGAEPGQWHVPLQKAASILPRVSLGEVPAPMLAVISSLGHARPGLCVPLRCPCPFTHDVCQGLGEVPAEDGQGDETHASCSLPLLTCSSPRSIRLSPDASPQQLVNTFHLPSGVGATCVLKTAFNNTLDQPMQTLNLNSNESKMLAAKYFDAMCIDSFTQGLPLSNFVPPPPSPAPSDYPVSVDEDLPHAWNSTTFSSAVKGITCAWCLSLSRPGIHLQQGDDICPLQKQLQGPLEVPISLAWPQQSTAGLNFWLRASAGPGAPLPIQPWKCWWSSLGQ